MIGSWLLSMLFQESVGNRVSGQTRRWRYYRVTLPITARLVHSMSCWIIENVLHKSHVRKDMKTFSWWDVHCIFWNELELCKKIFDFFFIIYLRLCNFELWYTFLYNFWMQIICSVHCISRNIILQIQQK